MIKNKLFQYQTKEGLEIRDITEDIEGFVKDSGVRNGLINIQSFHTTATVFVNENEPLLIKDIKKNLEATAVQNIEYDHDNFDIRTVNMCDEECANGHAHCKAIHLPTSVVLNIVDSKIQFGRWQRILFVELDRARPRKVQAQIIGE